MAKMYPPRFTRSEDRMRNAEKRFFDACRDQLGDDWTVLYEVSWFGRRNQGNERGDADFPLMHPQMGIFCVALKGGQENFVKRKIHLKSQIKPRYCLSIMKLETS